MTSATLDLDIAVRVGELDLRVATTCAPGDVLVVLGPNGAGKTTLLRAVAGLQPLQEGSITHGGATWDAPDRDVFVATEHRGVGMVFQDPLLFPHLNALDNVGFGLRRRGATKTAARSRAADWLDRVGLADRAQDRPAHLSGGQLQRVALARALAPAPQVLLLDEPLSALDASTRNDIRRRLRQHLRDFEGVSLLVTHDPIDALLLADDILVLEDGVVTQRGPVNEVTSFPRSSYVAELVGVNLFTGRAEGGVVQLAGADRLVIASPLTGDVFAVVRPNAVTLQVDEPHSSARNRWRLPVTSIEVLGDRARVHLGAEFALVAEVTLGAVRELGLEVGDHIWASVKATEIDVYPA